MSGSELAGMVCRVAGFMFGILAIAAGISLYFGNSMAINGVFGSGFICAFLIITGRVLSKAENRG